MDKLIFCEFNMDAASVADGDMVSVYCPSVEDRIADTPMQRAELDWLIFKEPLTCTQLVLSGEIEE